MKIVKYGVVIIVCLVIFVWLGVKDALGPVQRTKVDQLIVTIGDASYQEALKQGKHVVKFGPMFWGLYPGGLAFSSTNEALEFARGNQNVLDEFSSGWAVYELSGDLAEDTYVKGNQRYLNKSLLVVKKVREP